MSRGHGSSVRSGAEVDVRARRPRTQRKPGVHRPLQQRQGALGRRPTTRVHLGHVEQHLAVAVRPCRRTAVIAASAAAGPVARRGAARIAARANASQQRDRGDSGPPRAASRGDGLVAVRPIAPSSRALERIAAAVQRVERPLERALVIVGVQHARRDGRVEPHRGAVGRGYRRLEQPAVAAGVHQRGKDVRFGAALPAAIEQPGQRVPDPAEIDLEWLRRTARRRCRDRATGRGPGRLLPAPAATGPRTCRGSVPADRARPRPPRSRRRTRDSARRRRGPGARRRPRRAAACRAGTA